MSTEKISQSPQKRLKLILGIHFTWLLMMFLLGGWWNTLLYKKSEQIAELEKAAGISEKLTNKNWQKTKRMLFWETGTFFTLFAVLSLIPIGLYWRDKKRSKNLEIFFASFTHELRTPLTSIRLQAESLADQTPGSSAQSALILRLLEDTSRLESQVEKSLLLARLEGGGSAAIVAVQIKPMIEKLVGRWLEANPNVLSVRLDLEDATVLADPLSIDVILKNMLENTLKHSNSKNPHVFISSQDGESDKKFYIIRYQDNGHNEGMEKEKLGQIFQKGPGSQGAGIGLYLVKLLMGQNKGFARFDNENGFTADLSFKKEEAS